MYFVIISICCSVIVSVLLKLARRYEVNLFQAVMWNYAAAGVLSILFLRSEAALPDLAGLPWYLYLALGCMLPLMFIVLGRSVRTTGIVRTDLAQRLSLFIPLLTAFVFFGEPYGRTKLAGLALGFVAICFSIPWKQQNSGQGRSSWLYPLIVFVGMGLIDILFKQLALVPDVPYVFSLTMVFVLAFSFCLIYFIAGTKKEGRKLGRFNLLAGLVLGFFNFGNILFYLKAHRALPGNPSLVFSSMNIGVIILGAVVGLAFGERLSLLNKCGLILAVVAIYIISYSA